MRRGELYGRIDASELDVHDILSEMISRGEVEALEAAGGRRNDEKFALTRRDGAST